MGKTIGNKGDLIKFDEMNIGDDGHYKSGRHASMMLVRHPNKKKRHFITREFKEAGGGMRTWRNRFDERSYQSDRMNGFRNAQNGIRRAVMKRNARQLVDEAEYYED